MNYIKSNTNKELTSLQEKNDRGNLLQSKKLSHCEEERRGTKWQDSHFATRSDPKGDWQEP